MWLSVCQGAQHPIITPLSQLAGGLHPPPVHPLGFQWWITCKQRPGLLRGDLFWQILYWLKGIHNVCVALQRSLALCSRRAAHDPGEGFPGCSPSLRAWPAEGPCLCQAHVGKDMGSSCNPGADMCAWVLPAHDNPVTWGWVFFLLGIEHSPM